MAKNYTTIDTQIGVIKNETIANTNTPIRIGTTFKDILDKVKDNDNVKVLTFTTDIPTTRLLIPSEIRKNGLELRYGNYREIYIGNTFNDTDWVLDNNWKQIIYKDEVYNKFSENIIHTSSWTELKNMRDSGLLKEGQRYSFPYICKYIQPETNLAVSVPTNNRICVTCINFRFSPYAEFTEHEQSLYKIIYDFDASNISWNTGTEGSITSLEIPQRGCSFPFDAINIKFRRYAPLVGSYISGYYNRGDFCISSNSVYMAMKYTNSNPSIDDTNWIKILNISVSKYLLQSSGIDVYVANDVYHINANVSDFKDLTLFGNENTGLSETISSGYRNISIKNTIDDTGAYKLSNIVLFETNESVSIEGSNFTAIGMSKSKINLTEGNNSTIISKHVKLSNLNLCNSFISCKLLFSNCNIIRNTLITYKNMDLSNDSESIFSSNMLIDKTLISGLLLYTTFLNKIENAIIEKNVDSTIENISSITYPLSLHKSKFDGNTVLSEDEKLEWFNSARFGMFIHWGIYAVPAGTYNGLNTEGLSVNYNDKNDPSGVGSEWILKVARIPKNTYAQYASGLTSNNFDADYICELALSLGMKYIVITAKHHDGFAMYPSKITSFNITSSNADVSILKQLKDSCKSHGLKFGIYFSHFRDWYQTGGFGQTNVGGSDIYTEQQHLDYINNYAMPMIDELIYNFEPDLFWFDGIQENATTAQSQLILNRYTKSVLPTIICNDRLITDFKGDYGIGEGTHYVGNKKYSENCYTENTTWGYSQNRDIESQYIASNIMINRNILESVSRGQNALINISPKSDGSLSSISVSKLNEISSFFQSKNINFQNTSRVNTLAFPQWGKSVLKGNILYLFIYPTTYNKLGTIILDGIYNGNILDVSGDCSGYSLINKDQVYITGISFNGGYPSVLKITYSEIPYILDYNILDDNFTKLNLPTFDYNEGILQDFETEISLGAFRLGNLKTRFKYKGTNKTVSFKLNNSGNSDTNIFSFTINNTNFTLNASNNFISGNYNLVYDVIYDIELIKSGDGWFNITNLEYL